MGKTGAAPAKEHKTQEIHPPKGKTAAAGMGHCVAAGCKHGEARFSFCEEHYEQFKFGLIKKSGEAVPDYDKKLEHYQAFRMRQKAHKVA